MNITSIQIIISQKLSKNIIIRMLCPLDEDNGKLTKQLVPFIGYKSIKPSSLEDSSTGTRVKIERLSV